MTAPRKSKAKALCDPLLEPALMAQILAGFTLGEADILRRAMGKKKADEMAEQRQKFVAGCEAESGIDEKLATEIFNKIEAFASYGFSRCVSGDTRLRKMGINKGKLHPTVGQMYRIRHDKEYAKSIGADQLHYKYRREGYGKSYSMNEEGRLVYNKVVDIRHEGVDVVYEVTTETGRTIRCNGRHRFPTPEGKRRLDELVVGDELYVVLEFQQEAWQGGGYGGSSNLPQKGQQGFQVVDTPYTRWKAIKEELHATVKECERCGTAVGRRPGAKRLEIHHRDGDYLNATRENAEALCVSCHKRDHYANGRTRAGRKGLPSAIEAIVSIEPVGVDDVYDVEMEAPYHTFATDTGIVTCNSHSTSYAILAYQEGYLRTRFPIEYMAAKLEHEAEDAKKKKQYLRLAKRIGVEVKPPSVNGSGLRFTPRDGRVYYGMGLVKYVGEAACQQIIDERDGSGSALPELAMQPDNAARVRSGEKTTTLRTKRIADGVYRMGPSFVRVRCRGLMGVDEAGGREAIEASEAFGAGGPKYDHTRAFLGGQRELWVHDLEPVGAIEAGEGGGRYADMADFVERILCAETNRVNTRAIESLIKVGAFDEFGDRADLLGQLEHWAKWATKVRDFKRGKRKSLPPPPAFDGPTRPPAQLEETLRWELELMGQYVSGHPLDGFAETQPMIQRMTRCRLGVTEHEDGTEERDFFDEPDGRGRLYPLLGVVTERTEKQTKTGRPYAVVHLQDADDRVTKLFAWQEALDRYGAFLHEGEKLLVFAKDAGDFPDSVQGVIRAAELVTDWAKTAVLTVRGREQVRRAQALAEEYGCPGQAVELFYDVQPDHGEPFMVSGHTVSLTPKRVRELSQIGPLALY